MNPNKAIQQIQFVLRSVGLLNFIEKFRFIFSVLRNARENRRFKIKNSNYKLPPQYLAYDAYSAPDWNFYKISGEETALALSKIAEHQLKNNGATHVLEWGCGPARVVRHLHNTFGKDSKVYGCDYNAETIKWCKKHIPDVTFVLNDLLPPLPFESSTFNFVYAISVFTHLSESVSKKWIDELYRVTRPGGVLVISTNGDSRMRFLLSHELSAYKAAGLVIRDKFEEGKKMFWACHSPKYLKEILFKDFAILEYLPERFPYTGQDMWVLRKPESL
jgi:ubiquinone/menaquinone biosynthesis C-methylase UbiE